MSIFRAKTLNVNKRENFYLRFQRLSDFELRVVHQPDAGGRAPLLCYLPQAVHAVLEIREHYGAVPVVSKTMSI